MHTEAVYTVVWPSQDGISPSPFVHIIQYVHNQSTLVRPTGRIPLGPGDADGYGRSWTGREKLCKCVILHKYAASHLLVPSLELCLLLCMFTLVTAVCLFHRLPPSHHLMSLTMTTFLSLMMMTVMRIQAKEKKEAHRRGG